MVNVTSRRQEMTETLMAAHASVAAAQRLWEEAESALERIEAESRHFRRTRRLVRVRKNA